VSKHKHTTEYAAYPCATGCTSRNRHAPNCRPDHTDGCGGCEPKLAEPGSWLCDNCQRRLERYLAKCPAVAQELWRGMWPVPNIGGVTGSAGGSPDFAKQRALAEHIGQIAHDLAWLAREVSEKRGLTHPILDTRAQPWPAVHAPLQTVQTATGWLLTHMRWMQARQEAPDWLSTLLELRSRAWRLIDRPSLARFPLPQPCPDCGGQLWASTHELGDPRPDLIECTAEPHHREACADTACPGCKPSVWEPAQWERLFRRIRPDVRLRMPVSAAARATGVPERTIRGWLARGRIGDHSTNGTALVDMTAVRELRDTAGVA